MKNGFRILWLSLFVSGTAYASAFSDVPESDQNYQAIEYLKSTGVINGYGDGTYKPDNLVSRAEATKLIMTAFNIQKDDNFSDVFSDVSGSDWFAPYVIGAYKTGLIKGYEDKTFRPATDVSLSESLKIVLTAAAVNIPSFSGNEVFADVNKEAWYKDYAYFARQNNIIVADNSGMIYPLNSMSRGDIAELIYRTLMVKKDGKFFNLSANWQTFQSATTPIKFRYDSSDWKVFESQENITIFRPDPSYSEISVSNVFPNSAKIVIDLDKNTSAYSANQYFSNIKNAFGGFNQIDFKYNNYDALEMMSSTERKVDWYIYLDNSNILTVFTEYGSGISGYKLSSQIKSMLATIETVSNFTPSSVSSVPTNNTDSNTNFETLLSEIFSNILISGKGMQMLNKMPSKLIIETDTIGVGTGPVDYYYCKELDYTFKYERADDLILDKRKGKLTNF